MTAGWTPAARARVSLFITVVVLALAWPAAALASGASFSSCSPRAGSSIAPSRATVSVSVYEAHGVRGSSAYSMYVDGVRVRASIVYARSGDYRRFRVTFKPAKAWHAGSHRVVVKVRDRRGNTSTTRWSFAVKASTVEAVTPLMSLGVTAQPPAGSCDMQPSYLGTATIVLNPPVGGRAFYRLDGGPVVEGALVVVGPPATGFVVHTLSFILVDAAGNAAMPMGGVFIVEALPVPVDITPPVTASDPELAHAADAELYLVASDDFPGSITTYWRIAGTQTANTGVSVDLPTPVAFGLTSTVIEYWSVDAAGNEESPHHSETVSQFVEPPAVRDVTAPVTTSNALEAYAGTATVTMAAVDDRPGTLVTCWSLDGGPVRTGTTVVVAAPPDPEEAAYHTIEFWSVDAAGNQEAHRRVTFLVEYDMPIIIDPPSHVVSGPCVDSGCHSRQIAVTHSIPGCRACHDSTRQLSYVCEDCHNMEVLFATHDLMPPQTMSDAKPSYVGDAVIHIWAMDRSPFPIAQVIGSGVAKTFVRLDGGDVREFTELHNGVTIEVPAPAVGAELHDIEFWSVDVLGNVEFLHNAATFEVEAPAPVEPVRTISDVKRGYVSSATIRFTATGGEGEPRTFYRLDGGPQIEADQVVVPGPLVELANHTIEYWSVDGAGTVELPHNVATFYVECNYVMSIPEVPFPVTVSSDARSSYTGPATITMVGSPQTEYVYYRLDGGAVVEGDRVTVPAPDSGTAQHTLEIWPADVNRAVGRKLTVQFSVAADMPIVIQPPAGLYPDGVVNGMARFKIVPPASEWGTPQTYYRLDGGPTVAGTALLIPLPASGTAYHTVMYWWVDPSGGQTQTRAGTIALTPTWTGTGGIGPV